MSSAKEKVRASHSCAYQSAKGTIWSQRGLEGRIRLGKNWEDAASRLPSPRAEGATQTAEQWIVDVEDWLKDASYPGVSEANMLVYIQQALKTCQLARSALRDDNKEAKHG